MEKSREELLEIRNFGEKSYRELYDKFRELDILPAHMDPDKIESGEVNEENNDDLDINGA